MLVLVILAGCAPAPPAVPPSTVAAGAAVDTRRLVVVASGESTFTVMHERSGQPDRTLDEVLKWLPYWSVWRAVALVVRWGMTRLGEAEREAATTPHVKGLAPRAVVAGAFARALVANGSVQDVDVLDGEPVGADRRRLDIIVRLAVPRWGLVRVREGSPDLLAGFADVRAQLMVPETGAILWEHEEDVTHPDRVPLQAFSDREFARQAMIDVLDRAGRRLASEYLYARGAGR